MSLFKKVVVDMDYLVYGKDGKLIKSEDGKVKHFHHLSEVRAEYRIHAINCMWEEVFTKFNEQYGMDGWIYEKFVVTGDENPNYWNEFA